MTSNHNHVTGTSPNQKSNASPDKSNNANRAKEKETGISILHCEHKDPENAQPHIQPHILVNNHTPGFSSSLVDDDADESETKAVEKSPDCRFFKFDKVIGRGSFKTVYKGLDTDTGVDIAWCELNKRTIKKDEVDRFREEATMLKELNHPNIVHYFDFWESRESNKEMKLVLITELLTGGTLKTFTKRFTEVKEKVIQGWARQILRGLNFLHTRNPMIIHRDLKCDNIFINGADGSLKLGDLGLATVKNASYAKSVIGTPEFMAPEMYDEKYDERVDIYAFGMCILELATGKYPYMECSNPAQIFRRVTQSIQPELLKEVKHEVLLDFINCSIDPDKNTRYSVKQLLLHPFLVNDETRLLVQSIPDKRTKQERASSNTLTPNQTCINRSKSDKTTQHPLLPPNQTKVEKIELPVTTTNNSNAVQQKPAVIAAKSPPTLTIETTQNNQVTEHKKVTQTLVVDQQKSTQTLVVDQKKSSQKEAVDQKRITQTPSINQKKSTQKEAVDQKRITQTPSIDQKKSTQKEAVDQKRITQTPSIDQKRITQTPSIDQKKITQNQPTEAKKPSTTKLERTHASVKRSSLVSQTPITLSPFYDHSIPGVEVKITPLDKKTAQVLHTNFNENASNMILTCAHLPQNDEEIPQEKKSSSIKIELDTNDSPESLAHELIKKGLIDPKLGKVIVKLVSEAIAALNRFFKSTRTELRQSILLSAPQTSFSTQAVPLKSIIKQPSHLTSPENEFNNDSRTTKALNKSPNRNSAKTITFADVPSVNEYNIDTTIGSATSGPEVIDSKQIKDGSRSHSVKDLAKISQSVDNLPIKDNTQLVKKPSIPGSHQKSSHQKAKPNYLLTNINSESNQRNKQMETLHINSITDNKNLISHDGFERIVYKSIHISLKVVSDNEVAESILDNKVHKITFRFGFGDNTPEEIADQLIQCHYVEKPRRPSLISTIRKIIKEAQLEVRNKNFGRDVSPRIVHNIVSVSSNGEIISDEIDGYLQTSEILEIMRHIENMKNMKDGKSISIENKTPEYLSSVSVPYDINLSSNLTESENQNSKQTNVKSRFNVKTISQDVFIDYTNENPIQNQPQFKKASRFSIKQVTIVNKTHELKDLNKSLSSESTISSASSLDIAPVIPPSNVLDSIFNSDASSHEPNDVHNVKESEIIPNNEYLNAMTSPVNDVIPQHTLANTHFTSKSEAVLSHNCEKLVDIDYPSVNITHIMSHPTFESNFFSNLPVDEKINAQSVFEGLGYIQKFAIDEFDRLKTQFVDNIQQFALNSQMTQIPSSMALQSLKTLVVLKLESISHIIDIATRNVNRNFMSESSSICSQPCPKHDNCLLNPSDIVQFPTYTPQNIPTHQPTPFPLVDLNPLPLIFETSSSNIDSASQLNEIFGSKETQQAKNDKTSTNDENPNASVQRTSTQPIVRNVKSTPSVFLNSSNSISLDNLFLSDSHTNQHDIHYSVQTTDELKSQSQRSFNFGIQNPFDKVVYPIYSDSTAQASSSKSQNPKAKDDLGSISSL